MDKYLALIRSDVHKWADAEPTKHNIVQFKYAVNDYINYIDHKYHLMKHCPHYYTNTTKICINNCSQCWIKNIRGDNSE